MGIILYYDKVIKYTLYRTVNGLASIFGLDNIGLI